MIELDLGVARKVVAVNMLAALARSLKTAVSRSCSGPLQAHQEK